MNMQKMDLCVPGVRLHVNEIVTHSSVHIKMLQCYFFNLCVIGHFVKVTTGGQYEGVSSTNDTFCCN